MKLISWGSVDLPKGSKFMELIFCLGPSFRATAQNGSTVAENYNKFTTATVFKLGILYIQNIINLIPWQKCMDQTFDSSPVFGLRLKRARNGPRFRNRISPSVFQLQFSDAQIILTLIAIPKSLLEQNFHSDPHFRAMGAQ